MSFVSIYKGKRREKHAICGYPIDLDLLGDTLAIAINKAS
jgi:hypothetical protein